MEQVVVSGVSLQKDEAKVTICDVPDRPGLAATIFTSISDANINVDMIVQNIGRTGLTDVSFTVPRADLRKVLRVARRVAAKVKAGRVIHDEDIAKTEIDSARIVYGLLAELGGAELVGFSRELAAGTFWETAN